MYFVVDGNGRRQKRSVVINVDLIVVIVIFNVMFIEEGADRRERCCQTNRKISRYRVCVRDVIKLSNLKLKSH